MPLESSPFNALDDINHRRRVIEKLNSFIQGRHDQVWSANWTFSGTAPYIGWYESGATADEGKWRLGVDGDLFYLACVSDDEATVTNAITVTRTGTQLDTLNLLANINATLSLMLDNDSNGTANASRVSISSGDANAAIFVAGSGRTSALVTGGPTGSQMVIRTIGSYPIVFGTSNTYVGAFDTDSTARNTRLLIYDVDNGQVERVSVGIADSGGVGFKLLRIPN